MAKNPENVYRRRFMAPLERLKDLCTFPEGEEGCWLYQGALTTGGYGQFWWKGKNNRAHRVSFQLAYGDILEYAIVRHKCHTPRCVNPKHLEVGTHADNMWDMVNAKRQASGAQNGNSRLVEADVAEIVVRYLTETVSMAELGRFFGVSDVAVSGILHGKLWASFTGILPDENLVHRRDFFLSRLRPSCRSPRTRSEGLPGSVALWDELLNWEGPAE